MLDIHPDIDDAVGAAFERFLVLYRYFVVQSVQARTLSVDGVWPDLHGILR